MVAENYFVVRPSSGALPRLTVLAARVFVLRAWPALSALAGFAVIGGREHRGQLDLRQRLGQIVLHQRHRGVGGLLDRRTDRRARRFHIELATTNEPSMRSPTMRIVRDSTGVPSFTSDAEHAAGFGLRPVAGDDGGAEAREPDLARRVEDGIADGVDADLVVVRMVHSP